MKKIIIIWTILVYSISYENPFIHAQNKSANLPFSALHAPPIDDQNWNPIPVFSDEFATSNRYWRDDRFDNEGKWRSYFHESGVIHPPYEHQVYQRENALFGTPSSGYLTLRATYNPNTTNFWHAYERDTGRYDYISGAIETLRTFKYGYFEIRTTLPPPNCGNFPAFWLWAGRESGNRYNEIDIFEHAIRPELSSHKAFTGTYYTGNMQAVNKVRYMLKDTDHPLTEFHTYAIEWSPEILIWYFDGKIVGSALYESDITDQPMFLKINYALDNYVRNTSCHNTALFPLDMVIDYVYVYQLRCDCDSVVNITNNSQLSDFSKSVKKKYYGWNNIGQHQCAKSGYYPSSGQRNHLGTQF